MGLTPLMSPYHCYCQLRPTKLQGQALPLPLPGQDLNSSSQYPHVSFPEITLCVTLVSPRNMQTHKEHVTLVSGYGGTSSAQWPFFSAQWATGGHRYPHSHPIPEAVV